MKPVSSPSVLTNSLLIQKFAVQSTLAHQRSPNAVPSLREPPPRRPFPQSGCPRASDGVADSSPVGGDHDLLHERPDQRLGLGELYTRRRFLIFPGAKRTIVDGPFAETKELIAGYWLWQVKSMEEALEWVRRCPDPMPGEEPEIEIRPVFELDDFGDAATPDVREREAHVQSEIDRRAGK